VRQIQFGSELRSGETLLSVESILCLQTPPAVSLALRFQIHLKLTTPLLLPHQLVVDLTQEIEDETVYWEN